jgi:uncharacterized protein YodC (DUF2158 family)
MRLRVMMALASVALAGSLPATDLQAHGGGGGHLGRFGGTHMEARVDSFGGVRVGGIGGGYTAGISRDTAGYGTGIRYGTGILRGRFAASALAQTAAPNGFTGAYVAGPAQNPSVGGPPLQTGSGPGFSVAGRDSVSTTAGMASASSASTPSNKQNEAAREFRSGNLVRLRSGGPLMTVKDTKGDQVDCFWTDFNGQINADSFPVNVLQAQ